MPPDMPLRQTTVRFASDAKILIEEAAREVGVSYSQFIREAALMRAAAVLLNDEKVSATVKRLARDHDD